MTWHKVESELTKVDVQEEFKRLFLSFGAPRGMALFDMVDTIRHHAFYFSPRCEALIKLFMDSLGCSPCEKPDKSSVAFLVGHDSDKDDIFL